MIKIIKPGKDTFEGICPKCGCEFTYELNNVEYGYVNCPYENCDGKIYHPKQDIKSSTRLTRREKAEVKIPKYAWRFLPEVTKDARITGYKPRRYDVEKVHFTTKQVTLKDGEKTSLTVPCRQVLFSNQEMSDKDLLIFWNKLLNDNGE